MAALDDSVHELYVSPQIEALLGFSQEQWLQDPFLWYRQLHPDDQGAWGAAFARTCSTGVNFKSEYRLIARDGHVVWIHGECQLINDQNGRPILLLGIAFDITERKLAEEKLQESNRALELAVRSERDALAGLQKAQAELTELNHSLENRVALRTNELEAAHAKLVEVARQAGMAEVASGVLHNVGNFLNTVNVRASLVHDKIKRSRITGFDRICQMLEEHSGDLGQFLANDERGRILPEYIRKLARHVIDERTDLIEDLEVLNRHIDHIKQLVSSQQSYAKGAVLREPSLVQDLVEDAYNINYAGLARHGITLERDLAQLPKLMLDRHKIVQILVNLVSNSIHACSASEQSDRVIRISVASPQPDVIHFQVADNGIGIPAENLTRIFTHGFTTRAEGHGFGLHSCANAAREMEGSLSVSSDGPGRGATFTLTLPAQIPNSQSAPPIKSGASGASPAMPGLRRD